MERRLRILEEKKLAEGGGEGEGEGEAKAEAEEGEAGSPPAAEDEGKALATTDQQDQENKPKAAAAGKSKKKNAGVKKSKAQQVLESRNGVGEAGSICMSRSRTLSSLGDTMIQILEWECNRFLYGVVSRFCKREELSLLSSGGELIAHTKEWATTELLLR